MQLFIQDDSNFTIAKPYFYFENLAANKEYEIYTDGSYIRMGKESFCCIGGIILEHKTSKKIGEFFAPINTKNSLEQHIIPNFEKLAINTALLIEQTYNLKFLNIFNDNLTEVSKYSKNENIKWISRKENIADNLVTYGKNQWKEKNVNMIKSFKFRNSLFKDSYDKNIFILPYSKPKNYLYYYLAINEDKEIIDYIRFNKANDFGEIELICKMLNNNFENINFNINKNTFTKISNYVQGNNFCSSEIKYYEDFFNMVEQNGFKLHLKQSNCDIHPKKETILNHVGFSKSLI